MMTNRFSSFFSLPWDVEPQSQGAVGNTTPWSLHLPGKFWCTDQKQKYGNQKTMSDVEVKWSSVAPLIKYSMKRNPWSKCYTNLECKVYRCMYGHPFLASNWSALQFCAFFHEICGSLKNLKSSSRTYSGQYLPIKPSRAWSISCHSPFSMCLLNSVWEWRYSLACVQYTTVYLWI